MSGLNNMNKTLCILGNSKVGDLYAKRIVSTLKNKFQLDDIKLIGNGGEHMKKAHNMNSIVDLEDMREKVLHLWRYNQKTILNMKYSSWHLYQHPYLRTNQMILQLLEENETFENIVRARPSCIVGLENEFLSREMIANINKGFQNKSLRDRVRRPDCYMLTNTVRHWDENHGFFCDEAFYTYALKQINKKNFVYPSHYIGQYGVYDSLRHIFIKSGLFNEFVKEDSILVSRFHSLDDVEKARLKVAEEFRKAHNLSSDHTLVFIAPGDTVEENTYCLEAFFKGYNEFIYKNSYPTSLSHYAPPKSNFKLVISLHKGTDSEAYVREYLKNSNIETELIVVTNENNEHFDAICASDFGFVYNGQMVSSAVALNLNFMTMQNMGDLHYFWHTWENRWLADINVNADRPLVKEMASGEFWFGKICEKLSEMHVNTDARWDQAREAKPFVIESLSYKALDRSKINNQRDLMINNEVYDEYEDPFIIMCRKIYNSMKNYQNSYFMTPDLSYLSKPIPSLKKNNTLF